MELRHHVIMLNSKNGNCRIILSFPLCTLSFPLCTYIVLSSSSSAFAIFTPPPLCFSSSGSVCPHPPSSVFAVLTPLCVFAVESACFHLCLPYSHTPFVSSSRKEAKEAGKPCASDDELEEQQDATVDPPNTNLISGLPHSWTPPRS